MEYQHNFGEAGSVGPETAERLQRPAQPIVFNLFARHHQLYYKGRKLAGADNQNIHGNSCQLHLADI